MGWSKKVVFVSDNTGFIKNFNRQITIIFVSILTFLIITIEFNESTSAHTYEVYWADGCCSQTYEPCEARSDHPRPACRTGHKATEVHSHGGILNPSCWGVGCIGSPSTCNPDIPTGSITEIPNNVDDDCDYFIDDEQCDDVDNDGDGNVDEDLGSCLLKLLFIPLAWQGTQLEFEAAAQEQWSTFQYSLDIQECSDNFAHRYLSVVTDNLPGPACVGNCGVGDVRNSFIAVIPNANLLLADFDVIVALTDQDLCDNTAGCSNGNDFIWLETDDNIVMSHELGHIFGLEDEYCSNLAGSTDERCNDGGVPDDYDGNGFTPVADINFLGTDLECDPRSDQNCCGPANLEDFTLPDCAVVPNNGYGICCLGNIANTFGGRGIMSFANAPGPRNYDDRSYQHLTNPPNPRSQTNLNGNAPMDCTFSHIGHQPIVRLSYSLNEDGQVSVSNASVGVGRLGIKMPVTDGRYGLEIRDFSGTLMYSSEENLAFTYEGPMYYGVNYSEIKYDVIERALRVPVQGGVSGPLKIIALKDGVVKSQTCIVPNGSSDLLVDSLPPTIQCPDNISLECSTSGGSPANSSVLSQFFEFSKNHTTDNCDNSPQITSNAPAVFNLGQTTVVFTAVDVDGNADSCEADVYVFDTVQPTVMCPTGTIVKSSSIEGIPA